MKLKEFSVLLNKEADIETFVIHSLIELWGLHFIKTVSLNYTKQVGNPYKKTNF